jgi:hypothetical protein
MQSSKDVCMKFVVNTVVFLKLHILHYVRTTVYSLQRTIIKLIVQNNELRLHFKKYFKEKFDKVINCYL